METIKLNVYYDIRSRRARACWNGEDRILPDKLSNRDEAEAAALTLVRKTLKLKKSGSNTIPEIQIWSR